MKSIQGSICAPKGFLAAGVHCGIRKNRSKRDLALIYSTTPAAAAAVYTRNLVKGAPLEVTKSNLSNGIAQAVICNSGNANTCNANGKEIAWQMCQLTAQALNIQPSDVVVASTGVIGQPLSIDPIASGIPQAARELAASADNASDAILTTDTCRKEYAVEFTAGGKTCSLGGIAKGSGMIHPNMATMLVFITCDAAISSEMLQKALSSAVDSTFNMVSVDGDTSTNDMVSVLCNGQAGNAEIVAEGADYDAFFEALHEVMLQLSRMIAGDGEGATRLLTCEVIGAPSLSTARISAKSVICSSLVKAAMFGADANWGRILCALGYSGCDLDVHKIDVAFASCAGEVPVCVQGAGIDFSEEKAKDVLSQKEVIIRINLNDGDVSATAWGCDLTYDYVKINGDYRT